MVERVDSLHIKIKIDVDPQDKEFIESLSSEMARADVKIKKEVEIEEPTKKEKEKPDLSTVPTFEELETRYLKKFIKKLEKELGKDDPRDPEVVLRKLQIKKNALELKQLKEGPLGQLHNLSTQATSNLVKMASNPSQIVVAALGKALGRYGTAAARGTLYAAIALLVYDVVLLAIKQFMEPGRWLDRRYRRIARVETMNFYERTLQEELRHSYAEMRVTTIQGLRGGASQVNGNLFEFSSGATGILQSSPYRSSQQVYGHAYLSGTGVDKRGNPKRQTVSGRFS